MRSSRGNKSHDLRRVTLKLAASIESLVKNKPGKFGGHNLKDDRDTVVKQKHRGRHGKPGGLEIPPVLTAEAQIGKVAVADKNRTTENNSERGEQIGGGLFRRLTAFSRGHKSRDFQHTSTNLYTIIETRTGYKYAKFEGHSLKDNKDTDMKQSHLTKKPI